MAWEIVETPNAKYVLIFGSHITTSEKSPLQFDALVVESGGDKLENVASMKQYENLFGQATARQKPVWVTDVNTSFLGDLRSYATFPFGISPLLSAWAYSKSKKHTSRRKFFGWLTLGLGSAVSTYWASAVATLGKGEIKHKKWRSAVSKFNGLLAGKGEILLRNAISAEKVEKFIAPSLRKGNAKPVIAMVWGGFHYGVKDLLLNPAKRSQVLRENNLERWVQRDYPQTFSFKLDKQGKIVNLKKYELEIKPKEIPKPREKISRRAFFTRPFRRA